MPPASRPSSWCGGLNRLAGRAGPAARGPWQEEEEEVEESTPSTTAVESDSDVEDVPERVLEPGPPAPPSDDRRLQAPPPPPSQPGDSDEDNKFEVQETLFIFDWDDTVLPSTWVQSQGLRLDPSCQPSVWQRKVLTEVAAAAARTLELAKRHGTVVLVTNAERGWIELSCLKFLPALSPLLETVKLVSARSAYEGPLCSSPLEWKLRAFDHEITRHFGIAVALDPRRRKNVLSLGDSVHEREALLRAATSLPNCRSKSLKFVERPDVAQICRQHELVTNCFERLIHQDTNLDLCIKCP